MQKPRRTAEKKRFFFEKKKQKTFDSLGYRRVTGLAPVSKIFCGAFF